MLDPAKFEELFRLWLKDQGNIGRPLESAFTQAFLKYPNDLENLFELAKKDEWDLERMSEALAYFKVDTSEIDRFIRIRDGVNNPSLDEAPEFSGEEEVIGNSVVITPTPGSYRLPKRLVPPLPNKTQPMPPQPEIVEPELMGIKKRLADAKAKVMSFLPGSKKGETGSVPVARLASGGLGRGGNGNSGSGDGVKKPNYLAIWLGSILTIVILLFSVFAFFKLNSDQSSGSEFGTSSVPQNLSVPNNIQSCSLPDGSDGVLHYLIMPRVETNNLHGYENSSLMTLSLTTPVFDSSKVYPALLRETNYLVAVSADQSVFMPVSSFLDNPTSECVGVIASGALLSDAEKIIKSDIQLAYKINFQHWTGWLVTLSLLAAIGFALISLFATGDKVKDVVIFIVWLLGYVYMTANTSVATTNAYLVSYFIVAFLGAVQMGSKSDLQEQKDSFESGSQFKFPDSMKSLYDSLARGFSLVGGFDWTKAATFAAFIIIFGSLYPEASSLYKAYHNQLIALLIGMAMVILCFLLEASRRGWVGNWWSFGFGIMGLFDYFVYVFVFGPYFPQVAQLSSTAIVIIVWLLTFAIVTAVNAGIQQNSDRVELQRDLLADGMLFYATMKLVAVLAYIFVYLM